MSGLHADLEKHMFVPFAGSVVLAVVGLALLGVLAGIPSMLPQPHGAFLLFAIFSLAIAYVGLIIAPRWYRRSSKIVTWAAPIPGRIVLQRAAGVGPLSVYASVVDARAPEEKRRYRVLPPPWPVDPLLGAPVEVAIYSDPHTRHPVAFRAPQGLLWCVLYTVTA